MSPAADDNARYPRCIMATVCVPWTADYALDEGLFRQAVAYLAAHGTKHLYIFGTAGEGHAVSEKQFQQITRVFVDVSREVGVEPMVGVISLSLGQVLDRIEWASSIGVRRFQVSLPSWGTCTEAEAFTFFQMVCTRYPDLLFLHYNLRRAGRLISASEYARLAEALPNLAAVKLAGATARESLQIAEAAPALRLFLTEKAFAESGALGVKAGLLISYASMNWRLARDYYDAVVTGDTRAVADHREQQQGVIAMMRQAVGDEAHMDGAFDTMFIKRHLPAFPLRLLPPYRAVSEEGYARFIESIRPRFPAWVEEA